MTTFNDYRPVVHPKKAHRCVWCHTAIVIGEAHLRYVGIYEGDFQDWRIHRDCRKPLHDSNTYEEFNEICPGPHGRAMACEC